jgi:hypothetical protein
MARKCHRQLADPILFSSLSSSGGGLRGRLGLVRVSGRSFFLRILAGALKCSRNFIPSGFEEWFSGMCEFADAIALQVCV